MEKTEWFPGNIKPSHIGAYERNYSPYYFMDWFDGKQWLYKEKGQKAIRQDRDWRGLKENPHAD